MKTSYLSTNKGQVNTFDLFVSVWPKKIDLRLTIGKSWLDSR